LTLSKKQYKGYTLINEIPMKVRVHYTFTRKVTNLPIRTKIRRIKMPRVLKPVDVIINLTRHRRTKRWRVTDIDFFANTDKAWHPFISSESGSVCWGDENIHISDKNLQNILDRAFFMATGFLSNFTIDDSVFNVPARVIKTYTVYAPWVSNPELANIKPLPASFWKSKKIARKKESGGYEFFTQ